MKLRDTIDLMCSDDYKDRFKAEYLQLKIRYDKLSEMIDKWNSGLLDFTPTCNKGVYEKQLSAMGKYLFVLEVRAEIEGVNITE